MYPLQGKSFFFLRLNKKVNKKMERSGAFFFSCTEGFFFLKKEKEMDEACFRIMKIVPCEEAMYYLMAYMKKDEGAVSASSSSSSSRNLTPASDRYQ